MIIDQYGNILQAWFRDNGPAVKDPSNQYGIGFIIGIYYTEEQKAQHREIKELKKKLADTDYQAIKFSDGAISEEEYAPVREMRQECRDRINEIEAHFTEPTMTREEIDIAEETAMGKGSDAAD